MLLDIAKLPTAENSAIQLHPSDNVAIARVPIPPGSELRINGFAVSTQEAIPAGHKVTLRAVAPGEMLLRYGQAIGRAKIADRSRTARPHAQPLVRGIAPRLRVSRLNEAPCPPLAPMGRRSTGYPPRGRPRRHPQLHRGGRRQQLRRAYRRKHRPQLRRRSRSRRSRRHRGVPPRRRLRPRHRSRHSTSFAAPWAAC